MIDPDPVLYVEDLARLLRITPNAVHHHLKNDRRRETPVLPPHFRIGRILAWRQSDVDAHFRAQPPAPPKRGRGRPRKR